MKNIQDPIEAKQVFISKIVEQAKRTNQPLTQLEEKMLWLTRRGIDAQAEYLDAAAEFDDKCDRDAYEEKISSLLQAAYDHDIRGASRAQRKEVKETYLAARDALSTEDHYLSIMVKNVFGASFRSRLSFPGMLLRCYSRAPRELGLNSGSHRLRLLAVGSSHESVVQQRHRPTVNRKTIDRGYRSGMTLGS